MQQTGSTIRVRCQLTRDSRFATIITLGQRVLDCLNGRRMALDNERQIVRECCFH